MRRATTLLVCAGLALAGCGGSESDDARSAVRSYLDAFVKGDGAKACSLMTAATRRQFVARTKALTKTADCALAIEAIRTQAGDQSMAALKKLELTDVKVTGNTARVTLKSGGSSSTAELAKEGGGWKISGAPGTQ
jgi:hypothetical protein